MTRKLFEDEEAFRARRNAVKLTRGDPKDQKCQVCVDLRRQYDSPYWRDHSEHADVWCTVSGTDGSDPVSHYEPRCHWHDNDHLLGWKRLHAGSLIDIYAINDEQGRPRYVGQSVEVKNRMESHWRLRSDNGHGNVELYSWLASLDEIPHYSILQTVEYRHSYAAEKYWIFTLNELFGGILLNRSHAERSTSYRKFQEELSAIHLYETYDSCGCHSRAHCVDTD